MKSTNAIIFGATSEIGKTLAKKLIARKYSLILSSRNHNRLIDFKNTLEAEYVNPDLTLLIADFNENSSEHLNTIEWQNIDIIFFCMGANEEFSHDMLSEYKVKSILNVNFLIPIKLVSNALSTWSNSPQPKKIIYISSIAAIRPINHYIYSSGKIAFEYILRGIVNKKEFKHISTYIFRAGNITTNSLLTTSSDNLAKYILNNINGKSGLFYFPFIWNYLSFIISIIPNFIFIKILPFLIEV